MEDDGYTFLLQEQFENHARKQGALDPLESCICDEAIGISVDFDVSLLQPSWSWRNVHFSREIAKLLINEKGEFNQPELLKAIGLFEKNLYSLGPERQHDRSFHLHRLKMLKQFKENPAFLQALKAISKPIDHQGAQKLIKETLLLKERVLLTDGHARQAALSALLCYLRQNVGSCFATAPAIVIQQDQSLQFLKDIGQLLSTGRLTRIFEGNSYSVPLSLSWGMGELLRPVSLNALGKNPIDKLALAPGLHAAFKAAGLIEQKANGEQTRTQCGQLLEASALFFPKKEPFIFVTADQILKGVLLHHFQLTEEAIRNFQERRVEPIRHQLMIQSPQPQSKTVVEITRYFKAYHKAKEAFKALTDNALLKSWEFTLASLSESKADFAKWNLYASLGIQPEDRHGIGESVYSKIQENIDRLNQEIEVSQSRYDHLFAQARYLEGRAASASTENELGWVRAEYQIRRHELNRVISERDSAYEKGRRLQGLYPLLIRFYGEKIPEYFQEVYDAQMHDVSANPYDDSPAGFRLLYKHGRTNTALWTLINTPSEYIHYLSHFFTSTELELSNLSEMEGLQKEVSDLVTTIILTLKRPEFLESSFRRLAQAYHDRLIENPLDHLDQVKRKPWSYISGGTMGTLVSCYWARGEPPSEVKRWLESENEYMAFLIDSMKELPLKVQKLYQRDRDKNLLAFSPTHAFNCKPGWPLFSTAWQSDIYTYTWIRDYWVTPQLHFLNHQLLDNRMMVRIIQALITLFPLDYRPVATHALSRLSYSMSPSEFREMVLQTLSYEKWIHKGRYIDQIMEEFDSLLYRFLPLFAEHQLTEKLTELFEGIEAFEPSLKKTLKSQIPLMQERVGKYKILTAFDLKTISKSLLLSALKKTQQPVDYHQILLNALRQHRFCYPEPFLFADTNWVKNVFGFTLNPGTSKPELWRFDEYGEEGKPINVWKHYLNGSDRVDWGLYIKPHEYGQG